MAKKQYRPGRTLIIFFLGVGLAYGLVALNGVWKPELGLDLQGGTRITLTAKGNPSSESLTEARQIIDNRVNGSGVAEAEVNTQGGDNIVVEIPGKRRRDLIETVERQAQLRFRLVMCNELSGCYPSGTPGLNRSAPFAQDDPTDPPSATSTTKAGQDESTAAPSGTSSPTDEPTDAPSDEPTDESTDAEDEAPEAFDASAVATLDDALALKNAGPTEADIAVFNAYTCTDDGQIIKAPGAPEGLPNRPPDDPLSPLVACVPPSEGNDTPAYKYLLTPAVIAGTDLETASFGIPQGQVGYVVTLEIGGNGQKVFATLSAQWAGSENQFAIVLDGQVISAPTFEGSIPNGEAQITGDFTESEANALATSLKFGALPISFDEPTVETIGPSLAGDQLSAGMTAGAFGLGLVLIYCLLYYRGLGTVVVASLLMAAAVTYALVLLLSETAGFTLTLPGIAGLIIAVGVTADSFIIFFERIRDEMREGKSMRVAVETGWKRAKVTRLAAQVVSLLSAAVLYIFATGAVKGFGFALGLTTLVDLAILFWFTKPMVSWLAHFKFFNSGNPLSGLSPSTLGIDEPTPKSGPTLAGGQA